MALEKQCSPRRFLALFCSQNRNQLELRTVRLYGIVSEKKTFCSTLLSMSRLFPLKITRMEPEDFSELV
jgi:hypothetical protein